jgi:hypothetical protein
MLLCGLGIFLPAEHSRYFNLSAILINGNNIALSHRSTFTFLHYQMVIRPNSYLG